MPNVPERGSPPVSMRREWRWCHVSSIRIEDEKVHNTNAPDYIGSRSSVADLAPVTQILPIDHSLIKRSGPGSPLPPATSRDAGDRLTYH